MYGNNDGGFRPRGGPRGGGFAPVQVGEELDVRIEAVGEKGDGIARKKGFVLFVPNAQEGDEIRVRVTKVLRKVGFAEKIGDAQSAPEESVAPAPRREEAPVQPMPEEPVPEDTEDFGEEPAEEPEAPEDDDSGDDQDLEDFEDEEKKEE